jgi:hypothetical protein
MHQCGLDRFAERSNMPKSCPITVFRFPGFDNGRHAKLAILQRSAFRRVKKSARHNNCAHRPFPFTSTDLVFMREYMDAARLAAIETFSRNCLQADSVEDNRAGLSSANQPPGRFSESSAPREPLHR